jgi:hypothetical protein
MTKRKKWDGLFTVFILSLFSILDFHSQGQGRKSDQNAPSVAIPKSHDFTPPFLHLRLMP